MMFTDVEVLLFGYDRDEPMPFQMIRNGVTTYGIEFKQNVISRASKGSATIGSIDSEDAQSIADACEDTCNGISLCGYSNWQQIEVVLSPMFKIKYVLPVGGW